MRASDDLESKWGIVCPSCFAEMAEAHGTVPTVWEFRPEAKQSDPSVAWERLLREVIDQFDYWAGEPRPAIGGGTVRLHRFSEVQPDMERVLDKAREALSKEGDTDANE